MFGIGSTELLVIFVVALIVLGPKSIPQIAKTLGKAMGEFKRVSTDFQRTMNAEVEMEEHEKRKKEAEQELFGDKAAPAAPAPTANTTASPTARTESAHDTSATFVAPVPEPVPAQAAGPDTVAPNASAPNACGPDAFDPDSPLAKAVAKAEAEAAARENATAPPTDGAKADTAGSEPQAKDKA